MVKTVDTFSNRLKTALALRDMQGKELAHRVGVSPPAVSQWKKGKQPTTDKVADIAKALDVDPAWLIGIDVPMGEFPSSNSLQALNESLIILQENATDLAAIADSLEISPEVQLDIYRELANSEQFRILAAYILKLNHSGRMRIQEELKMMIKEERYTQREDLPYEIQNQRRANI